MLQKAVRQVAVPSQTCDHLCWGGACARRGVSQPQTTTSLAGIRPRKPAMGEPMWESIMGSGEAVIPQTGRDETFFWKGIHRH